MRLRSCVRTSNPVHLLPAPLDPREAARLIIPLGRRGVPHRNRRYRHTGPRGSVAASLDWIRRRLTCRSAHGISNSILSGPAWSTIRETTGGAVTGAMGSANRMPYWPHSLYPALGPGSRQPPGGCGEALPPSPRRRSPRRVPFGRPAKSAPDNARFPDRIELMTGQGREAKLRGRPPCRRGKAPPRPGPNGRHEMPCSTAPEQSALPFTCRVSVSIRRSNSVHLLNQLLMDIVSKRTARIRGT